MTNWRPTTLGAISQVAAGNSAPQGNNFFIDGVHPFFRTSDVGQIRFGEIFASRDYLNDAGAMGLRKFPRGTILFPKSGASTFLNHRVMLGSEGFVSSHLATIVGDEAQVDRRFLLYFLSTISAQDLIQDHAYPSLNLPVISGIPVCIPPLMEQQRIVAILDEAFDGIATAKANAEKNLQNAKALFQSHLESVFSQSGEGWQHVRIEDACDSIMDCVNKTATKVDAPTEFKMIRTTNVRNGVVNLDSVNYVSEDVYRVWTRRQIPQRGDVILTREAPMGEVGMLLSDEKVFLGQRLVSYRADPTKLNNRFLLYALQSGYVQGQIHGLASGSTVQHMRVPDSKNLKIPLPSLGIQEVAVIKLDILKKETQRLESIYQQKLAALDELKKSLLHQAFSGQLTAETPTLAPQHRELQTATPQFSAKIISLAYARHAKNQREKTFGRVKEQKLLHLTEAIAKIDLGRHPMKDAAGPNDFQHMLKAEDWARSQDFFEMVERSSGKGYDFKKLKNFDRYLATARKELEPYLSSIEKVIDLLIPMDSEEAGIFATIHAAWNNLLMDGIEATDGAILKEARETWHADKLAIPEHKFKKAIEFIRRNGLVPDGTGKYVAGQTSLL